MRDDARCPVAADLPGADHAATLDDGPGGAPDMVAVSAADLAILTDNSTRLAKVQADAAALIAAGVAVATPPEDPEHPKED